MFKTSRIRSYFNDFDIFTREDINGTFIACNEDIMFLK